MDGDVEVAVEMPVGVTGEGHLTVVIRVVRGELRPGSRLDRVRAPDGEERPVDLAVRRLWLFTREAGLIGPSCSGRLELTGHTPGELTKGSRLFGGG